MNTKFRSMISRYESLAVFRNLHNIKPVSDFISLLGSGPGSSSWYSLYGSFLNGLIREGGNLTDLLKRFLSEDENSFMKSYISGSSLYTTLKPVAESELQFISELNDLIKSDLLCDTKLESEETDFLPEWERSACDFKAYYESILAGIKTKGYGIFLSNYAFKIKNGRLTPVKNADLQDISTLYGYQRERMQVLRNTEALAEGLPASNVLLYGDAGTGKSTTVKACARALADRGVRLVEFEKKQISQIPDIIDALQDNPLKFIFFIDDLSFTQNDDDFCYLKGILEGTVTGSSSNIVVYATSNRRHLVKETMDERSGNDIHLSDTLQENMSLAARFGLSVTFSKPARDVYLDIIENLAAEYGIEVTEDLYIKAEAFAIRSNGRSPRTAKQFIKLVKTGLK